MGLFSKDDPTKLLYEMEAEEIEVKKTQYLNVNGIINMINKEIKNYKDDKEDAKRALSILKLKVLEKWASEKSGGK